MLLFQIQHNYFYVALHQIEDLLASTASIQRNHAGGFILIAVVWKQCKQAFIDGNTAVHGKAVPHTRNAQSVGKIFWIA